jgi:hypothetical protein
MLSPLYPWFQIVFTLTHIEDWAEDPSPCISGMNPRNGTARGDFCKCGNHGKDSGEEHARFPIIVGGR